MQTPGADDILFLFSSHQLLSVPLTLAETFPDR